LRTDTGNPNPNPNIDPKVGSDIIVLSYVGRAFQARAATTGMPDYLERHVDGKCSVDANLELRQTNIDVSRKTK